MSPAGITAIDGALTIEEAAAWLDPPMPGGARQLAELLAVLRVAPAGVRPTGRKGRPPFVYDPAVLMRVHAQNAEWLFPPAPPVPAGPPPPAGGCER
jgi:hypothetical protein